MDRRAAGAKKVRKIMKTFFAAVLLGAMSVGALAQDPPLTKEQKKQQQRAQRIKREKDRAAAALSEANADYAPTSEVIDCKADRLRELLVAGMARGGFAIAAETQSQITFTKDLPADYNLVNEVVLGNESPRAYQLIYQIILVPQEEKTQVSVNAQELVQNRAGGIRRYVVTDVPVFRRDIGLFFQHLKEGASADSLAHNRSELQKDIAAATSDAATMKEKEKAKPRYQLTPPPPQ
jgi:hypothetical protein